MEDGGSRIDRCSDFIFILRSSIFNIQLGRRRLPLRFGGQTPAGPTAVGFGLVPVHVNDRPMRLKLHPMIKVTAQPATADLSLPVNRVLGARFLTPAPTRVAPKSSLAVASILDEGGKLLLRHRRPC